MKAKLKPEQTHRQWVYNVVNDDSNNDKNNNKHDYDDDDNGDDGGGDGSGGYYDGIDEPCCSL